MREEDVPAEQPQEEEEARIPPADAQPRGQAVLKRRRTKGRARLSA